MAWLNLASCLAAVLTIWPTSQVSAAFKLKHLSSIYLPYNITSAGPQYNLSSDAVEQIGYDAKEKIVYAAGYEVIHVIDVADANNLVLLYSKFVEGLDLTDVEVCDDYVFVSADNQVNRLDGKLQVYKKHRKQGNITMQLLKSVPVGPGPDNIYPRAGCKSVIVALEAEAFFDDAGKFVDPEGGVVIVSWSNGPEGTEQTVRNIDFKAFNSKVSELLPTGVRFVYRENNNTFSADLEPEYIALDPETNKAYVCLQENNAVAEVDLGTETVTQVYGLGYKQWGVLDASDRDLGIQLSYWPIRAWYQPDAIQFVSWKGRKLVVSANEGDLKKYSNFREYQRGKQFTGLGDKIPDVVKTWLQEDSQLGRLKMSKLDGKDANGVYQALYTYGARSFSIWDAADGFRRIYDSGSDIEKHTAFRCPHAFNTEGDDIDEKSDSKGPETESLAVGQIGDRMYFFVGNENPGTILVYSVGDDVTQPRFETIFCDGLPDNKKTLQEKFDAREIYALDPEDLKKEPTVQWYSLGENFAPVHELRSTVEDQWNHNYTDQAGVWAIDLIEGFHSRKETCTAAVDLEDAYNMARYWPGKSDWLSGPHRGRVSFRNSLLVKDRNQLKDGRQPWTFRLWFCKYDDMGHTAAEFAELSKQLACLSSGHDAKVLVPRGCHSLDTLAVAERK